GRERGLDLRDDQGAVDEDNGDDGRRGTDLDRQNIIELEGTKRPLLRRSARRDTMGSPRRERQSVGLFERFACLSTSSSRRERPCWRRRTNWASTSRCAQTSLRCFSRSPSAVAESAIGWQFCLWRGVTLRQTAPLVR